MNRPVLTLMLLVLIGSAVLLTPLPTPRTRAASGGDVELFRGIVSELRQGAPYYEAFGTGLRRDNYPAGQAFNWRTPLHLATIAVAPEILARVVLIALGGLLVAATLTITLRESPTTALVAGAMQLGVTAMISAPPAVYMGESWAGLFVGLSTAAYALSRHTLAISLTVLALFFRELAAPYYVICGLTAVMQNRKRAVIAWTVGLMAYAIYYARHVQQVGLHQQPGDLTHPASWLQFGGLPFLLSTVRWNAWLTALPPIFTGVALVLIVLGVANARAPLFVRLTSAAYAVFFLLAGQSFNQYWGLIAWPTWAICAGFGADDLVSSIRIAAVLLRSRNPLRRRGLPDRDLLTAHPVRVKPVNN